jgi:hypothetical protein
MKTAVALILGLFTTFSNALTISNVTTTNPPSGRSAAVSFGNATSIFVYGGVLGTCAVSPVTSDLWGYATSLNDWHFLDNETTGE